MTEDSPVETSVPSEPLALRLGRAVATLDAATFPDRASAKARLCVLDWLSSALSAGDLPWSRQAVALALGNSGGAVHGAGIVARAETVSRHDAAFANGVLGHGLVRDDMHVGSVSHLGAVLIPTLFALAETPPSNDTPPPTGRDFLAALIAGYEIGGKLGRMILDVDVAKIFRPTGITGPIAAAAAGARLRGLDPAATARAIALAANTVAGYNEWAATGGSEMFFHAGFAARSAVSVVELAAAGAHASPTALDGPAGLLAAFGKVATPGIAEPFADGAEILAVFFKPVPACNYAQSAAQAAQAIAARRQIKAAQVEDIVVRVTHAAALYPGCDVAGPFAHILQAKMSIQYNVAAAVLRGNFEERNYAPADNADIVDLARRTAVEIDAGLTGAYPAKQGAEVLVALRSGEVLRERRADVVPTDAAGVRKRALAAATAALGHDAAHDLIALVDDLEHVADAAELPRRTRAAHTA